MSIPILADYNEHRTAFGALLEPICSANILLLEGQSGSGKTTLLRACLHDLPMYVTSIRIEMHNNATPIHEIFFRVGERRGWESMPTFIDTLRAIPKVEIDTNRLIGINNQINVALNVPAEDRDQHTAALTDAWFADLRAQEHPYLIAIDTYEAATPEVRDWLAGPFLARAAAATALRVLIAGQTVPNPHNIEWGHCCTHCSLHGVPEATHWLPVVKAMGRYIDAPDPLSWLAGICYYLKGAPNQIMQVIEGLPCIKEAV